MQDSFLILSIDGGGFRGAFSAHVLKRIEEEFKVDWRSQLGMIAGTSTGSIIAAGIASGISSGNILDLYEKNGSGIFWKRPFSRLGLFSSKFSNKCLHTVLDSVFGETTLGEIDLPLIIPATDIGNGGVHVFKSSYSNQFLRDKDVLVKDAVLASCSAPTYFSPFKTDKYFLADGGLWANSPGLVAAIDAKKRLGIDLDRLKILSIGTGIGKNFYSSKHAESWFWGIATRWGRGKFIDMILNLQSQTASNMLGLLLRPEHVFSVNFESDTKLSLDDPSMFDDLISRADQKFTHLSQGIKTFLEM